MYNNKEFTHYKLNNKIPKSNSGIIAESLNFGVGRLVKPCSSGPSLPRALTKPINQSIRVKIKYQLGCVTVHKGRSMRQEIAQQTHTFTNNNTHTNTLACVCIIFI